MSWVDRLEKAKKTELKKESPIVEKTEVIEPKVEEKSHEAMAQTSFMDHSSSVNKKDEEIKAKVHKQVLTEYNNQFLDGAVSENDSQAVMELIKKTLANQDEYLTRSEQARLSQIIFDDVVGLGPLEPLLRDEEISEIMVNDRTHVYVERHGKLELTGIEFKDDDHILRIINRIVSKIGRRCDESTPMVDARLLDGSRVNAVIPPVALKGPSLTIRKFSKDPLVISDLIGFGSLSTPMANFLEAAVKGKCNIIVAGGTGSGKTTLLNCLSGYIPSGERIVTVEDAAEIQLAQEHVVTLESRPANVEGKGRITIRDLVRNCLRMRPDRVIVGECRSEEALDMLQAMNTGHDGSLTTVHANTPRDVISRLETMVMMAGFDLPERAIREQIASAIDLIVQQRRFRDGSRRVTTISEVVGMEGDTVTLQDIFVYEQTGVGHNGKIQGEFVSTGIHPKCVDKIKDNGGMVRDDWFVQKGRRI